MTSWHKISKNSFQNRVFLCFLSGGHFWPLEAKKREKPYSVDPKILSLDLKIVSFAIFWPPEAENNILTLCQFIFVTGTLKWFTMITA